MIIRFILAIVTLFNLAMEPEEKSYHIEVSGPTVKEYKNDNPEYGA